MRAHSVPAEQQYQLIMECRSSGLTDYQWCMEHGIKPGTFYNWVKRIRQSGCADVPAAVRHRKADRQEIVQIAFDRPLEHVRSNLVENTHSVVGETSDAPAIELIISGDVIRISNTADLSVLERTIRLLKELSC